MDDDDPRRVGLVDCPDADEVVRLTTEVERLTAALQQERDSAAWCDKHKPNGGHRAACLVCACVIYSSALSRISYLCGEPNEMECGPYDIHCDESAVVEQVKQLTAERDALQADAARYRWLRDMDEDPICSLAAMWTNCKGSDLSISKRVDAAVDAARGKNTT